MKKFNYFEYAIAWVKYASEFLARLANISNVIRDSFADIHIPQKHEYEK